VSYKAYDEATNENKKLKYRIVHLLRSLEQVSPIKAVITKSVA